MRKLYLTLPLVLSGLVLTPEVLAEKHTFRLRTVDNVDSLPIPGTRVDLFINDTVPVLQKHTDKYGILEAKGIEEGEYLLLLSTEGYNPFKALFSLYKDVNLGDIALKSEYDDGITLDNLVVEGAKVTRDAEWLNVIPPEHLVKQSFNTMALIRGLGLPGVWIAPDGQSISIRGKGAPLIKVNGIKRSLAYLNTINIKNIAKVKYTDFPQAGDLQEGINGVIDIILKEPEDGYSTFGQLSGVPYRAGLKGYFSGSYNWDNSEVSVSVDDTWKNVRDTHNEGWGEMSSPDHSWVDFRRMNSCGARSSNTTGISATYTLQTPDGLQFNSTLSTEISRSKSNSHITYEPLGRTTILEQGFSKDTGIAPSLDLYMRKEWKDGRAIEANVTGKLNFSKSDSHTEENYPGEAPYFRVDNGYDSNTKGIVGEIKWTQPLRRVSWTVGLKESLSHAKNDYATGSTDNMNQSNTYLNTALGGKVHDFSYYVGGGGSLNRQTTPHVRITDWQASATFSLNQNIGSTSLRLAGDYTPTFPTLRDLTQVIQGYNSTLSYTGNTGIRTAHNWNLNLSYFFPIRKVRIFAQVLNNHINRMISFDYFYDPKYPDMLMASSVNIQYYNFLAGSVNVQYDLYKDNFLFQLQCQTQFMNTRIRTGEGLNVLNTGLVYLYLYFKYKNCGIAFNYTSPMKYIQPGRTNWRSGSPTLSVHYDLKNFEFEAYWYNMFTRRGGLSTSDWYYALNKSYYENYTPSEGNKVELRISYRMQGRRQFRKRNRGLSNQVVDQSVLKVL